MIRKLRHALRELSRPQIWLPLWLVLALGVLNPAACLVHCAPSHAELHARLHNQFFGFLCSMPSPAAEPAATVAAASTTLQTDPTGNPSAVFACALLVLALLPLLHVRRWRRCSCCPTRPLCSARPLLPPPRRAWPLPV